MNHPTLSSLRSSLGKSCLKLNAKKLGVVCENQPPPIPAVKKKVREPNKTELRFKNEYLRGGDARYEGLTLHLSNHHSYTPDFVVLYSNGDMVCVEVKGKYRFGSHQRARCMFDLAVSEYPCFRWLWASLRKDGTWKIEET